MPTIGIFSELVPAPVLVTSGFVRCCGIPILDIMYTRIVYARNPFIVLTLPEKVDAY